jgi:hypothetical protein
MRTVTVTGSSGFAASPWSAGEQLVAVRAAPVSAEKMTLVSLSHRKRFIIGVLRERQMKGAHTGTQVSNRSRHTVRDSSITGHERAMGPSDQVRNASASAAAPS